MRPATAARTAGRRSLTWPDSGILVAPGAFYGDAGAARAGRADGDRTSASRRPRRASPGPSLTGVIVVTGRQRLVEDGHGRRAGTVDHAEADAQVSGSPATPTAIAVGTSRREEHHVGRSQQPVTLSIVGGAARDLPIVPATEGNDGIVVSSLLRDTGMVTVDPGFMNTASCESQITYIDGDAGHPALPRVPDRAARRAARRSSRSPTCSSTASCPTPSELDAFDERDQPAHAAARGLPHVLRRRSRATRTRWPCCRRRSTRCRRSTRTVAGPVRPGAGRALHRPAPGQDADDHVVRAQEVASGQPLLYPDNSLGLRRGLPADDVRGARPSRTRSTRSSSRRSTMLLDPARRPRAELLDVDGAASSARARPTCSRRSRPASTRCSGPLHGGANEAVLEMLDGDPGRRRRRRRRS